ncbi:hypothetical protein B10172_11040 [Campylobacter jejuni]|nr:hypothetical protein B10172_11040 [Campylobacter jejuni]
MKKQKIKMTLGSLFAGIGGIELGFKKVGFDCVWAVEIDQKACETYKANHQNIIINKDINDVKLNTLADIDILTAGFPCQAFSVAGYRKGFNDERGNVFFGILRYLEYFKPKIVFLENVKNLKTHDKGKTLKIILKELQKLGYFVKYEILNTAKYGNIPQNRERIYMIGFWISIFMKNLIFQAKLNLPKVFKNYWIKRLVKNFIMLIQNIMKF